MIAEPAGLVAEEGLAMDKSAIGSDTQGPIDGPGLAGLLSYNLEPHSDTT
jgi:hypothetical protein